MLDKLPSEILYEIGGYLDYRDLTSLRFVNHNFDFIFGYIIKSRLMTYLQKCGIQINSMDSLSNTSICILLNMLFFVRKNIKNNVFKMLTINITNTFFKRYYFKTSLCNINTLEKCHFFMSCSLFDDIQFDRLENIISRLVIEGRSFEKNDNGLYLNNMGDSKVVFMRTDYNVINERCTSSNSGKKYMVTFHFFI